MELMQWLKTTQGLILKYCMRGEDLGVAEFQLCCKMGEAANYVCIQYSIAIPIRDRDSKETR
jgi:hypothetical protein